MCPSRVIKRREPSEVHQLCRVIGVGDADQYDVQLHQLLEQHKHTIGFPTIIVQEGGRITSVSHEAKELGITRQMREHHAKEICPSIFVIPKKKKFDKSDSTQIDEYSVKIRSAVLKFRSETVTWSGAGFTVQITGCDEFIIDLSDFVTFLIEQECILEFDPVQKICMEGKWSRYDGSGLLNRNNFYYSKDKYRHTEEVRLAFGLKIMDELCTLVFKETGIIISGGVGSNKVIGKLACSLHKPAAVTALTRRGFYRKSNKIPFRNVSGFGGELGESLQGLFGELNLKKMRTCVMKQFDLLNNHLEDNERAEKARDLVLGICYDPVLNKLMSKGTNCGKGGLNIRSEKEFRVELNIRVQNILDKMQKEAKDYKRIATRLNIQYWTKAWPRQQRTFPIDLEVVEREENGIGWVQKSLFDATFQAAVTDNPDIISDLEKVIERINFWVSDYHQFAEVCMAVANVVD